MEDSTKKEAADFDRPPIVQFRGPKTLQAESRRLSVYQPKGKPYRSENVVRSGVHRTMDKLGIVAPKGAHAGIHCFRHSVASELLEAGTPIHVVTRLARHADSKVTLEHYAHILSDSERVASERLSRKIEAQESDSNSGPAEARTA